MGRKYKAIFNYGNFVLYASDDKYYRVVYVDGEICQTAFDTDCLMTAFRFLGNQCFFCVMENCRMLYPELIENEDCKRHKNADYDLEKLILNAGGKNEN